MLALLARLPAINRITPKQIDTATLASRRPCTHALLQGSGVNVYAGQPGMASTDFFNPKKFDILKIGAVSQYLAQKVIGLTPAQGAAPCILCCLKEPEGLIGECLAHSHALYKYM